MQKDQNFKDCIKYFKSNPGYKRIFEGFREKYEALGRIGGNVILSHPDADEIQVLRGLLQRDFSRQDRVSVSAMQFEKALKGTRFQDYSLFAILEGYFGGKLTIRRDEQEARENEQRDFFHDVLSGMDRDIGRQWIEHVLSTKEKPYALIMQGYKKDKEELAKRLLFLTKALDRAAEHTERAMALRLPIFAATLTGNPHYFDEGSEADRMLTAGLCFLLRGKEPSNAEEKAELLYRGGIIKDDISNFTVTFGLMLEHAGSSECSGASFANACEPLHLSLANISGASRIYPYNTACTDVYVMENPAVFSAIIDEIRSRPAANFPALVCVSGQPRLASLVLLDKLVQNGHRIYYAGDFDPEGLAMADRLKKRYGSSLTLWRYEPDDYHAALPVEIISPARIKKLEKIEEPALLEIASLIRQAGRAGYQEQIIKSYLEDIQKI